MLYACLALAVTSARAVPNDPTVDPAGPDVSGETTSVVKPTGFEYIAGGYDGRDGGVETWDSASVGVSTLGVPNSGRGYDGDQNDSGWQRHHQHYGTVPDGGSTGLLLGSGFLALGLIRRHVPWPLDH